MKSRLPATNEIVSYLHCGSCLRELPSGESPESYARLSIGYTPAGLQVWCVRHRFNVIHLDFGGHKLSANTKRAECTCGKLIEGVRPGAAHDPSCPSYFEEEFRKQSEHEGDGTCGSCGEALTIHHKH